MAARNKHLLTFGQVLEELGGARAVTELLGVAPGAAWNWEDRGYFPADTYVALTEILANKGCTADPILWRQRSVA